MSQNPKRVRNESIKQKRALCPADEITYRIENALRYVVETKRIEAKQYISLHVAIWRDSHEKYFTARSMTESKKAKLLSDIIINIRDLINNISELDGGLRHHLAVKAENKYREQKASKKDGNNKAFDLENSIFVGTKDTTYVIEKRDRLGNTTSIKKTVGIDYTLDTFTGSVLNDWLLSIKNAAESQSKSVKKYPALEDNIISMCLELYKCYGDSKKTKDRNEFIRCIFYAVFEDNGQEIANKVRKFKKNPNNL